LTKNKKNVIINYKVKGGIFDMEMYKIIDCKHYPEYVGRIGTITVNPKVKENVMFYPIEGKYPYRICLPKESIELVK